MRRRERVRRAVRAHGAGIDWIGLVAIDDAFVSFRFVSFRFVRGARARGREGNRGVTISIDRERRIGCASSSRDHGGVG